MVKAMKAFENTKPLSREMDTFSQSAFSDFLEFAARQARMSLCVVGVLAASWQDAARRAAAPVGPKDRTLRSQKSQTNVSNECVSM